LPTPAPEKKEEKVQAAVPAVSGPPSEVVVKNASKPLARPHISSRLSISSLLNKEEKQEVEEKVTVVSSAKLPEHHFTDTDVQTEWNVLLKDPVLFNAVKPFKLTKIKENIVQISYPSDSAKNEFDKISIEFFNHFKHKVNNHSVEFKFKKDHENMKIEIMTKRKIFEKLVEKNPLLKDLDDLLKFDLT